jgi:VWFA-related protein
MHPVGRLRVTSRLLVCGLAWITAAASACAQPPGVPVIRMDVRQVLVPVIVTDGKGHHITGLKGSDFQILEDGVPQEIAAFSTDTAPSAGAAAASLAASTARSPEPASASAAAASVAAPERTGHTFVICIDALDTAFVNSARTREMLTRLFEKEKPAGAQYVLLSIGPQLRMLQTATSDPAAVLSSLRGPAVQPALGGSNAATLGSELSDLKKRMYDFCRRCPACGSSANYRACDSEIQSLILGLDAQAEHWAILRRQLLAQLKSVVEELAKLPAGRSLILVSDGFSLQPAREFYAVAAAFLPGDPRLKMAGPADLESNLQAVIKAAVERNVRIYSVDSRGLAQGSFAGTGSMDASAPSDNSPQSVIRRSPSNNRGGTLLSGMDHEANSVAFQNGSGMEQLALSTGGIYFHDSNDMLKQFRQTLADGREYYLLAYVPKNRAQDGKYRSIAVEVANKKLHVRAKPGYWAEPAQE